MRPRAEAERRRARLVSSGALLAYAAAALAPLIALLASSASAGGPSVLALLAEPRSLRAIGFTLAQAGMSTLAALAVGLPGAALVARYRFPGRGALKTLSVLPFALPSVLMVLAFVLFYGRSGYLNRFLMWALGLHEAPITFLYSFWGIVLVHGFYEFPIVLQTVGEVWERLPRERENAARLLGAGKLRAWATGTLPSLAPAVAQAAALCFLLCFFSFAVVMVFGGLSGSTLEVEVYRLSRLEADQRSATALALAETLIAILASALVALFERGSSRGMAEAKSAGARPDLQYPRGKAALALGLYVLFLGVFFGGPLFSLLAQAFSVRSGPLGPASFGLGNFAKLPVSGSPFAAALVGTLSTALPAALIAAIIGSGLAFAVRSRGPLAKAAAALPLAVSGIVASLGWGLLFPRGGLALIPFVQALGAMPYVTKSVAAALSTLDRRPIEAARSLGASKLRAALGLELRAVLPALLAAFAFAFASAAGDLNVPLVLGQGGFETLSVYLYRLTSSYRFPEACAAGVVLGLVSSLAFAAKEARRDNA